MKKPVFLLAFAVLLACNLQQVTEIPPAVKSEAPEKTVPPAPTAGLRSCTAVLPEAEPGAQTYQTVLEEFEITAPSGNTLYGLIRRPDPAKYSGLCFAAVVLVPGGINPGRMTALDSDAILLSAAGMVVVTFNAEGRADDRAPDDKRSQGSEDTNGFRNQDGLCKIVEYAAALPYAVPDNVGIASQSFGIATAAGCAGRHPEAPVKYLVDGEGPPISFVTCKETWSLDADPDNDQVELIFGILGHYSAQRDPSEANRAFWAEREAIRYIGAYRGRYLRLQATWDHAQPPSNPSEVAAFTLPPDWWQNKHTTDIVNAAVAGGVPWVRVNLPDQGNPVNGTYTMEKPPVYLPGALADGPWTARAVLEMARMP
ncbi:MAG: hypothetical protein JW929_13900 [Anaerolineales bacterium]|nr:hypothetical protein [Anaerolineales bacterium]